MSTSTAVVAEIAPDAPPAPPTEFAPVARGERIASIDFVRGLALLGILLVNTANFFAPMGQLGPQYFGKLSAYDQAARLLVGGLCFTKFISIFSMLFGYGLLMQLERAERAGHSPGGFAARRLGTLAVFGLLHGLALWYGDVLLTYAMCGAFVVIFRKVPARELLILAAVFLCYIGLMRAVSEAMNLGVFELLSATRKTPPGEPRGWDAVVATHGDLTSPTWMAAEKAAYAEGPLGDVFLFRSLAWAVGLLSILMGFWCQIVAMFLVGMWMYRVRFFAPEQAGLRKKAMRIGLSVGLLIEAISAGCFVLSRTSHAWWAVGASLQAFSPFFLPIGYVALFVWLCERLPRLLTLPVMNAGRMALTVYLSETLVATTLAYFYGFGWFGKVTPVSQLVVALAIWCGLVAFSTAWLAVFPQGPMEWLWRRLEYGARGSPGGY